MMGSRLSLNKGMSVWAMNYLDLSIVKKMNIECDQQISHNLEMQPEFLMKRSCLGVFLPDSKQLELPQ